MTANRPPQQQPRVRPADTRVLVADPEPAAAALGWRAAVSFEETIDAMVAADLARLRTGVEESERYLRLRPDSLARS